MVIPFGESGTAECVAHADEDVPKRYIRQEQPAALEAASHFRGFMEADDMMDMPEPEFRRAVVDRLDKQDEAITGNTLITKQVAEDTAFIRSAWTEGITAVRFFCRLAAAWRFLLKQMLIPMGLPALGLYGFWYYVEFHRFPGWLSDCFKFLMAVL